MKAKITVLIKTIRLLIALGVFDGLFNPSYLLLTKTYLY